MRRSERPPPRVPTTDYSAAVARAIAWLGDRYLLARPVNTASQRLASYWLERLASAAPSQSASEVVDR